MVVNDGDEYGSNPWKNIAVSQLVVVHGDFPWHNP